MKYLMDKKSWIIAVVESAGIVLFNVIFLPDVHKALGDTVSAVNLAIIGAGTFVLRILWFYGNLLLRLMWGKT